MNACSWRSALNVNQQEGMFGSRALIRLVNRKTRCYHDPCVYSQARLFSADADTDSFRVASPASLGADGGAEKATSSSVGEILKEALKSRKQQTKVSGTNAEKPFDYFVVVDFEATCDETVFFPQEIIEFPSVLIAVNPLKVEDSFQTYVKPVFNTQLTEFCKRLTGIQQSQVDSGMFLADALEKHDKWLQEKGVKEKNFGVITWTDWDCKVMLNFECKLKGLKKPEYFNRWINLKSLFKSQFGDKFNLKRAVLHLGLEWQGREHCGLDDAKNTASLAMELMKRGVEISYTHPELKLPAAGKPAGDSSASNAEFLPKLKKILEALPASNDVQETKVSDSLCYCGLKCKTRLVRSKGPNQGKYFLSCGNWTLTEGGKCTYFEWTAAVQDTPENV